MLTDAEFERLHRVARGSPIGTVAYECLLAGLRRRR
jgi:hypothetical protein